LNRYSLIFEESEYYDIFDENQRNEFLFHLFKNLCLGGSLCQYEERIDEYLNVTKLLYKQVLSVAKDPETSEIKILSHAFKIHSVEVQKNY
jgi:cilia- and flagella-associated protein 300